MSPRARTAWLLGALGGCAALVAIDRSAGGGADEAAPSPRSVLAQQAALTAQVEAIAASAPAWRSAAETAQASWEVQRAGMLAAPSAELAASRLRELASGAIADLGLRLDASAALRPESPVEGEPLRVVGVRLELRSPDPARVHALIDRLEHLPDARAAVRSVSLVGPSRGGGGALTVAIDLQALAWLGEDA